jgi:DNA-binding MarR family transcriptional regulator
VVDNLERRELVERRAAVNDRRSNALRLAPGGVLLLKKLKRLVSGHERRLTQNLTGSERIALSRLLKKILPEYR